MPDIYVIGDTIRFTANIVNMDGDAFNPAEVTVTVLTPDGSILLDESTAISEGAGSYIYDWTITGITVPANLIVVWEWNSGSQVNIKRQKFRVVPQTDY